MSSVSTAQAKTEQRQTCRPRSLLLAAGVAQEYEDYVTQCSREHREAFDKLITQHAIDRAQAHLLNGFAEDVTPRFVREHNIGLLVMGALAHGHLSATPQNGCWNMSSAIGG